MSLEPFYISTKNPVNVENNLAEIIDRIKTYSIDYHNRRPDASPRHCLEIGAGTLIADLDQMQSGLVQSALTEMAARWLFDSKAIAAE